MSIACVALFAAFANGESLIPQGANVAPPTGRGALSRPETFGARGKILV